MFLGSTQLSSFIKVQCGATTTIYNFFYSNVKNYGQEFNLFQEINRTDLFNFSCREL